MVYKAKPCGLITVQYTVRAEVICYTIHCSHFPGRTITSHLPPTYLIQPLVAVHVDGATGRVLSQPICKTKQGRFRVHKRCSRMVSHTTKETHVVQTAVGTDTLCGTCCHNILLIHIQVQDICICGRGAGLQLNELLQNKWWSKSRRCRVRPMLYNGCILLRSQLPSCPHPHLLPRHPHLPSLSCSITHPQPGTPPRSHP
jgi:hypothetical protein